MASQYVAHAVPTHMTAAYISSAHSTIKTVGNTWNLTYELKCSDPCFIKVADTLLGILIRWF